MGCWSWLDALKIKQLAGLRKLEEKTKVRCWSWQAIITHLDLAQDALYKSPFTGNYPENEVRYNFSSDEGDGKFVGSAARPWSNWINWMLLQNFRAQTKVRATLNYFQKPVVLGCHAFFRDRHRRRFGQRLVTGKHQACTLTSAIKLPASFYIGHVRGDFSGSARFPAKIIFGQGVPAGQWFCLLTPSVARNRIPRHSLVLDVLRLKLLWLMWSSMIEASVRNVETGIDLGKRETRLDW